MVLLLACGADVIAKCDADIANLVLMLLLSGTDALAIWHWCSYYLVLMLLLSGTGDCFQSRVAVYLAHTPAGTSTQNVIHFGQQAQSDRYQAYDYGSAGKINWHNN